MDWNQIEVFCIRALCVAGAVCIFSVLSVVSVACLRVAHTILEKGFY